MNMHDRKQLARNARVAFFKRRAARIDLAAPTIMSVLPGEPLGLIPAALLSAPLQITIPLWVGFPPNDRAIDHLFLQWRPKGGGPDDFKDIQTDPKGIEIKGPITDYTDPMPQSIPLAAFEDLKYGEFDFRYGVQSFNGGVQVDYSAEVPLVIDSDPPYGNSYPADLIVSQAHIVDANSATVEVEIPVYSDSAPGDKIALYWLKGEVPEDLSSLTPIGGVQPVPTSLKLSIPEATIKAEGDGDCYAVYVLIDKAGNASRIGKSNLVQVTLGPLPAVPLPAPTVRHADDISDQLIDRQDAFLGVYVEINTEIPNWKLGDTIVAQWGATPLPAFPISTYPVHIPVGWPVLTSEYDFTPGVDHKQDVVVQYRLLRGSFPFASDSVTVQVDLAKVGPVNPDEPNPVNPALGVVTVKSFTDEENKIVAADKDEDARALVPAYDGIGTGQEIKLFWNGRLVGNHAVTTEIPGDPDIEIPVSWADIDDAGNGIIDVHFEVAHPDYINEEQSVVTQVEVSAIEVVLPLPVFPKIDPNLDWLNCPSLELGADGVSYGVVVHIPASRFLLEGTKAKLKWTSFTDTSTTDPLADGELESGELTVSNEQETNGLDWWVGPYEQYFLPIYGFDADNNGSGKVEYTLTIQGVDYTEAATVEIAMWGAGSSCKLPIRS